MSKNHRDQDSLIFLQKLLASGNSPEAQALTHTLDTPKGGLGSWGPKTRAAFAAACGAAGIHPERVDFSNPDDPELLKLIGSLRSNEAEYPITVPSTTSPRRLVTLLGKDLGELTSISSGDHFAEKILSAARKHHVLLKDISELKYADLDGDGNITKEEISALIDAAHAKRTGNRLEIYASSEGENGRMARNPNYDPKILPQDLEAMLDKDAIGRARDFYTIMKGAEIPIQRNRSHHIGSLEEPDFILKGNNYRGVSEKIDFSNDDLDGNVLIKENRDAKLDGLLKAYAFQVRESYSYKNIGEDEREIVSNIQSTLTTSKTNGIA